MSDKSNILVFPVTTEIGHQVYKDLLTNKHFNAYGACSRTANHLGQYYILPNIEDPDFLKILRDFISMYKIDLIYPTNDAVLVKIKMLQEQGRLNNATVIGSSYSTTLLCRSKSDTYKWLSSSEECSIFVPKTYEKPEDVSEFPVFVKPDKGQGSKNCFVCENSSELWTAYLKVKDPVICEYLPGDEFTIDCFTNALGKLVYCSPRKRESTKAGISTVTSTLDTPASLKGAAARVNNNIRFLGAWFLQMKKDAEGNLKLLEVSARVPGGYILNKVYGVNLALMGIYGSLGYPVKVPDYLPPMTATMVRHLDYTVMLDHFYPECVFIDFDDTLIQNDEVNPYALALLQLLKNRSVKAVLVTRRNEVFPNDWGINDDYYFTDVICNKSGNTAKEWKAEAIAEYCISSSISSTDCILIDDSFSERNMVGHEDIKAYDPDFIQNLLKIL